MSSDNQPNQANQWIYYYYAVLIALLHLGMNLWWTLPELIAAQLHCAAFGSLCVLLIPDQYKIDRLLQPFIAVTVLISTLTTMYLAEGVFANLGELSMIDQLIPIQTGLCLAYIVWRTQGIFLPLLALVGISYVCLWGSLLEGIWSFAGLSAETLIYRLFYTTEGFFGSVAQISWTYVFMFILFGSFLVQSGASEFIFKLALSVAGKSASGPGIVAILSSGLMGSVSGSAVANAAATGVVTIPLMKKSGFSARFAAGLEAAASTGGQLMPPIMGAGAFVMASYTQINYTTIISVAFLPALLYFFSLIFWVQFETKRANISPQSNIDQKISSFWVVLKSGWRFLLPILSLVLLLLAGYTPVWSAGGAIITVIICSWFSQDKMTLPKIMAALAQGAQTMAVTAVLLIFIGLIVNLITLTGFGNTLSLLIADWAGHSLLLMLLLIAIVSLVLGMGLPVTAAYIVLATLSAPALYQLLAEQQLLNQLQTGTIAEAAKPIFSLLSVGDAPIQEWLAQPLSQTQALSLIQAIPSEILPMILEATIDQQYLTGLLLTAHMIIFWLSQDSNITPPVCLAAYTTATIANTSPMKTGFTAWRLAKGLYWIPVLMAYTPIVYGTWWQSLFVFFIALIALYFFFPMLMGQLMSSQKNKQH